jgi:hypothetical protein
MLCVMTGVRTAEQALVAADTLLQQYSTRRGESNRPDWSDR